MADIPRTPVDVESILTEDRFLRSLAYGLLGERNEVEDAVQDSWLRSLVHPGQKPGALRSFLTRILRNRIHDLRRGARRRSRHERAAARPEALPSTEEMVAGEEMRRRVGDAVLALKEPYRTTIWLSFREALPPREVAMRMGVPVSTVRTRVRRALAQMRSRLDTDYGDRKGWSALAAACTESTANASVGATALTAAGAMTMKKTIAAGVGTLLVLLAGVTGLWFLGNQDAGPASQVQLGQMVAIEDERGSDAVETAPVDRPSVIEGRIGAPLTDAPLATIRVLDEVTRRPLPDTRVDLTKKTGQRGPNFLSDADGSFDVAKQTLLEWELVRVDRPGYFLAIHPAQQLGDTVLLVRNQPVHGRLINTSPELRATHDLQIWLRYPFLQDSFGNGTVFGNSQRNKDLREGGLQGDRIRIDPPFDEDAELRLIAVPRVGIGFEVLETVPLPRGQTWVEIDLSDLVVKEQTSSLEVSIRFEGPTPIGAFQFELKDETGNGFLGGHLNTQRREGDRRVSGSIPSLKPGTYSAELRFSDGSGKYFFSGIEIDGPTQIELTIGVGASMEATLDVDLVPEIDFRRFPVSAYIYDDAGHLVRSSTLRSREENAVMFQNLVPGEYTFWAQARNQMMISEMVTASVGTGERLRLHFELLPARNLELVSGIEGARTDRLHLELRADGGAVLKLGFNPANARRTRILYPDIYTVVCQLENYEFRERVDLRNDDARVVIR